MKTSGPIRKDPKAYDRHLGTIFHDRKLSAFQAAYAYMLSKGGVDAFISDTPNLKILDENLGAAGMKLTRADVDAIEEQVLAGAVGACHHCGACTASCPEGVRVADVLRSHAYENVYGRPEMARDVMDVLGVDSVRRCTHCDVCQRACPAGIDLSNVVRQVRGRFA